MFHQVGRDRVDTTWLLVGTLATIKISTLCSNVVSKWGEALSTAVIATVISAPAVAPAAPTLVLPLYVPASITCKWCKIGDGQVLHRWSLKQGFASLHWLPHLEQHRGHVLYQQGDVLKQRLLVRHKHVVFRRQFLRHS
jgi:hypothetical protein